ncbi:MAG: hypothetical protein SFU27_11995 [Thermonemataceae bacterium]|nr:hypothetical protein [Thermonemataceae bacterium]
MKNTKILLFLMLLGVLFTAFKCSKKDPESTTPAEFKGSWKITSITNSAGATPTSLESLLNGTAVFGDTNYEFKDNTGASKESGTYAYDAAANTLTATPAATSVITNSTSAYTFSTTLTVTSATLKVNIAAAGKPANEVTLGLTKQQ